MKTIIIFITSVLPKQMKSKSTKLNPFYANFQNWWTANSSTLHCLQRFNTDTSQRRREQVSASTHLQRFYLLERTNSFNDTSKKPIFHEKKYIYIYFLILTKCQGLSKNTAAQIFFSLFRSFLSFFYRFSEFQTVMPSISRHATARSLN